MSDWGEAKARLEQDVRLAGTETFAQVYAADIRAALGEIKRLREDALSSAPPYYRKWEEAFKRAEAAEAAVVAALDESTATKVLTLRIEELKARVEELEGDRNYAYRAKHELEAKLAEAQGRIAPWERALPNTAEHVAEVERLRDEVARLANLNIHIGDDAAKDRAEVERLRAETVKISVVHPPIDERIRELTERVTDLYADVMEWRDTAERHKRRAEAAEAKLAEVQEEARLNRAAAEKHYAYGEAQKERAEAAEAKLAESNAEKLKLEEAGLLMLKLRDKAEAEVERLRGVPDTLHRPDADHLRGLEGDQTEVDRYWMGWTDALDRVSAALRGGGE